VCSALDRPAGFFHGGLITADGKDGIRGHE
jgi:hypothetical protein